MEKLLGIGFLVCCAVIGVMNLAAGNFEVAVRFLLGTFGLISVVICCVGGFWVGFPMLMLIVWLATNLIK
jgi:hypothetical protein